jgi:two-component system LytT family response regulator
MKAIIIETAKENAETLQEQIHSIDIKIDISASFCKTDEALLYFSNNPQPDLLFMEPDPANGICLDFFNRAEISCPVVYILNTSPETFAGPLPNCLDTLTRPVDPYRLRKSIQHYRELQDFFIRNHSSLFEHFNGKEKLKSRILIKKGTEYQTCRIADVAYFYSGHKLVFLVDRENRKYLTTARSLSELHAQLDPGIFYRANRKFIVNVNYIQVFSMANSSRIRLQLALPVNEPIVISQQNTSLFKQWMGEKL